MGSATASALAAAPRRFIFLGSCGVGPGDEVITVSHTAVATVAAIDGRGETGIC